MEVEFSFSFSISSITLEMIIEKLPSIIYWTLKIFG